MCQPQTTSASYLRTLVCIAPQAEVWCKACAVQEAIFKRIAWCAFGPGGDFQTHCLVCIWSERRFSNALPGVHLVREAICTHIAWCAFGPGGDFHTHCLVCICPGRRFSQASPGVHLERRVILTATTEKHTERNINSHTHSNHALCFIGSPPFRDVHQGLPSPYGSIAELTSICFINHSVIGCRPQV